MRAWGREMWPASVRREDEHPMKHAPVEAFGLVAKPGNAALSSSHGDPLRVVLGLCGARR